MCFRNGEVIKIKIEIHSLPGSQFFVKSAVMGIRGNCFCEEQKTCYGGFILIFFYFRVLGDNSWIIF